MDVNHIVSIELPFRTVFWKEIGLDMKSLSETKRNEYAIVWEGEVEPWLATACKSDYRVHADGVWFCDPADAMLFKLTWSGYFS